ncbi:hypothetical protein LTR95_016173 [Oleoguttula sp. CCFEE 5521]
MRRRDLLSRRSKTAKVAMDGLTRLMREETRREELKQQARDARSGESSDGASSTATDSVPISILEESYPDLIKAIEDLRQHAESIPNDGHATRGSDAGTLKDWRDSKVGPELPGNHASGDGVEPSRGVLRDTALQAQTGAGRKRTHTENAGEASDTAREAVSPIRRVLGGIKPRPPEDRSPEHENAGTTHDDEQARTDAFESAVAQGATRDRDGATPVRDEEPGKRRHSRASIRPFRAIYWKNLAYLDAGKKKVSAQQAMLQRERHPINEGRAWR